MSSRDYQLYKYTPSKVAAIVSAIVFAVCAVVLVVQLQYLGRVYRRRGLEKKVVRSIWSKHICLLLGCVFEAVGFLARIVSSNNQNALGPYIVQSCLVLVAPALMAASIYMLFGRMLRLLQLTSLSFVPSRFFTAVFVTGDLVSFMMQCTGGGMMATESKQTLGTRIVSVGLVVQLIIFGLFMITEVRFAMQAEAKSPLVKSISRTWFKLNMVLFAASMLILVRSVIRLVEFFQGFDGYIITREWFLYAFDALPMAAVPVMVICIYWRHSIFELEDEVSKFECDTLMYNIKAGEIIE
ncbi:Pug1p Ecym_4001 [Eremothecium cymbalariae DBVPG|uniref:Uncharacterized protein n=1 Tax=Eremothecium cymbalariae (strain CBS 270.75 / DBVPG 7215 / KCTC 17166 / NRRL Y-17582) TaxID=931890 RepID=G8JST2_ERECY|nr:hypothetical protein Ecym_4001 [Eremothecium cymbalariae DBVPG\